MRHDTPDLIGKRAQVSNDILEGLRLELEKYGAQVVYIDMRNFAFSGSCMKASNDTVTQEQLRLAAGNKVGTVEAEANALKAQADGEACATIKAANAQAEALCAQNEAPARS